MTARFLYETRGIMSSLLGERAEHTNPDRCNHSVERMLEFAVCQGWKDGIRKINCGRSRERIINLCWTSIINLSWTSFQERLIIVCIMPWVESWRNVCPGIIRADSSGCNQASAALQRGLVLKHRQHRLVLAFEFLEKWRRMKCKRYFSSLQFSALILLFSSSIPRSWFLDSLLRKLL